MPGKIRNIAVRILSAVPLAGFIIASAIWWKPLFYVIVCLGGIASWIEWHSIVRYQSALRPAWQTSAFNVFGLIYLMPAAISLIALGHFFGWRSILFLFATVWASDTSAYMIGRSVGGAKLIPSISPNKTWAGAFGGIIGGAAASLLTFRWIGSEPVSIMILAGMLLSVLTQIGDLLESIAKRRFQVKDSGWLIPGHGGILDRIDGLLLAAPFFAIYRFSMG